MDVIRLYWEVIINDIRQFFQRLVAWWREHILRLRRKKPQDENKPSLNERFFDVTQYTHAWNDYHGMAICPVSEEQLDERNPMRKEIINYETISMLSTILEEPISEEVAAQDFELSPPRPIEIEARFLEPQMSSDSVVYVRYREYHRSEEETLSNSFSENSQLTEDLQDSETEILDGAQFYTNSNILNAYLEALADSSSSETFEEPDSEGQINFPGVLVAIGVFLLYRDVWKAGYNVWKNGYHIGPAILHSLLDW